MYDGHGLFLALLQRLPLTCIGVDYIEYTVDADKIRVKKDHQLDIRCQDDGSTILWLISFEGEVIGKERHKSTKMTLGMLFDFVKRSYG